MGHRGALYILQAIYTLAIIRLLPITEYGIYALAISVHAFSILLLSGLISKGFIKYVADGDSEDNREVITNSLFLQVVVTALLSGINYLAAPFLASWMNVPQLEAVIKFLPILLWCQLILGFCLTLLFARLKVVTMTVINIINMAIALGLLAVAYKLGLLEGAIDIIKISALASALSSVVALYLSRRELRLGGGIRLEWLRRLLGFGKWTAGSALSSYFFNRGDVLILSFFLGPVPVALLAISRQIYNASSMVLVAFQELVLPYASRIKEKGHLNEFARWASVRFTLLNAPIALGLILFPALFIQIIGGTEYAGAAAVLQIFGLVALIKPFTAAGGGILTGMGRPQVVFYIDAICVAINLGLDLILIPIYGATGAAYANLGMIVVATILMMYWLKREIGTTYMEVFIEGLTLIKHHLQPRRYYGRKS